MNIVHIVWYKLSDLLASYHLFIWNTLLYFYLWPGWLIYSYPYLSNAFISDTLVSLSLQCITMMWSIILYWHPLLSIWAASSSWYSNKTVRIFCEHLASDLTMLPGCVSWPHPLSWYNIVSIDPYFQMYLNPQLVLILASPVDFDLHQINPIFGNTNYAHFLPDSSAEYWIQNVNLLNCSQGCVGAINKFQTFSATFCHFHSSQVNNARFSWKFKNLKKATKNRSYLDRASGVNMMDLLCEQTLRTVEHIRGAIDEE